MEPLRSSSSSVSSSSAFAIASYDPAALAGSCEASAISREPLASVDIRPILACADESMPLERVLSPRVFVCNRPVDVPILPHAVAVALADAGAPHRWIKVDDREVGMGRADGKLPGQGIDYPGMETKLVDHGGQAAEAESSCEPVVNVDADCIDRALVVGKDTGRWIPPQNDCHTITAAILAGCARDVTGSNEQP